MKKDPVLVLAGKWFDKLSAPTNATFRLLHSAREGNDDTPTPFSSHAVLQNFRDVSRDGMELLRGS